MIFVSGVHGSGKTYFCQRVKESTGYVTYSASKLISERRQSGFASDKLIPDIADNQLYLLSAINELDEVGESYLLDGHFCLLDADGVVTRIAPSTFAALHPSAFVLITAKPEIIAARRQERDGMEQDAENIRLFQNEEIAYASTMGTIVDFL